MIMETKNHVFIATSLDGFIADGNGGIDFLDTVPNPKHKDLGYKAFMNRIDAIVMGRRTFETVLGFNIPWPYQVPVFVVSSSMEVVHDKLEDKVKIINASPTEITKMMKEEGFGNIYVDGGITIQRYLQEDKIDEITISTIPVILGAGISLFGNLSETLEFEWVSSEVFLNAITQITYRRKR